MRGVGIVVAPNYREELLYRRIFGNPRWLTKGGEPMLWTIFVILLVLWLLGVVSSYTIGGFIHILLVLALVVLLINIIGGRRTVV